MEEQEPDFSLFNDRIRNLWKARDIEIEYITKKLKGFYIFIFNIDEGMLDALEKGPWTIGDVQLVLMRWGPGSFLEKHKEDKKNPVWIRMYDMPHGLWKLDVVKIMSSMFAEYARVLVDVDTTGDLEEVARELGVPLECQRFWTWAKRQNHTYHPYRPLTRLEETKSDSLPLPPPHVRKEDILVFFKLYDPDKLQL
ncbi:unnamed protein product [Lactuca virosa]|uniref:DUF4283 domain-containing protein n=1 Tax=Lactuca virosa TaxID=75947 RepID=A0AAU9MYU0_9ASTR|nr:unnamed protein product [Lactuca virosa]